MNLIKILERRKNHRTRRPEKKRYKIYLEKMWFHKYQMVFGGSSYYRKEMSRTLTSYWSSAWVRLTSFSKQRHLSCLPVLFLTPSLRSVTMEVQPEIYWTRSENWISLTRPYSVKSYRALSTGVLTLITVAPHVSRLKACWLKTSLASLKIDLKGICLSIKTTME